MPSHVCSFIPFSTCGGGLCAEVASACKLPVGSCSTPSKHTYGRHAARAAYAAPHHVLYRSSLLTFLNARLCWCYYIHQPPYRRFSAHAYTHRGPTPHPPYYIFPFYHLHLIFWPVTDFYLLPPPLTRLLVPAGSPPLQPIMEFLVNRWTRRSGLQTTVIATLLLYCIACAGRSGQNHR